MVKIILLILAGLAMLAIALLSMALLGFSVLTTIVNMLEADEEFR